MPDRHRPAHLLWLATLFAVVLGVAAAQAASTGSSRVHTKKPWKARYTYRVMTDLNGRLTPRLEPRFEIDFLHANDWVHIDCQVRGEQAYGSDLWDRVTVVEYSLNQPTSKRTLYVPDHFIETYTSGKLKGAPYCAVVRGQRGD